MLALIYIFDGSLELDQKTTNHLISRFFTDYSNRKLGLKRRISALGWL